MTPPPGFVLPVALLHCVVAVPVPLGIFKSGGRGISVAGPAHRHVDVAFKRGTLVHIVVTGEAGGGVVNQLGVGKAHERRVNTVGKVAGYT